MKIKIGTVLEEDLVKRLKERSGREGRPLSEVLQDALAKYLNDGTRAHSLRIESVKRFCTKPFNIDKTGIDQILEEDYFET
jgi:hypothetical protein